eukprot:PhF_6_TR816/c0_g1_i1/m.1240
MFFIFFTSLLSIYVVGASSSACPSVMDINNTLSITPGLTNLQCTWNLKCANTSNFLLLTVSPFSNSIYSRIDVISGTRDSYIENNLNKPFPFMSSDNTLKVTFNGGTDNNNIVVMTWLCIPSQQPYFIVEPNFTGTLPNGTPCNAHYQRTVTCPQQQVLKVNLTGSKRKDTFQQVTLDEQGYDRIYFSGDSSLSWYFVSTKSSVTFTLATPWYDNLASGYQGGMSIEIHHECIATRCASLIGAQNDVNVWNASITTKTSTPIHVMVNTSNRFMYHNEFCAFDFSCPAASYPMLGTADALRYGYVSGWDGSTQVTQNYFGVSSGSLELQIQGARTDSIQGTLDAQLLCSNKTCTSPTYNQTFTTFPAVIS